MAEMKTGIVVRLKSGGPKMTVGEVVNRQLVRVSWFVSRMPLATAGDWENWDYQSCEVHPEQLEPAT
jgi:uncharacterized protein YodC (DUF2158 family)